MISCSPYITRTHHLVLLDRNPRIVIPVLDFQHAPGATERDERIKHSAAIAHANKLNAVLVLLPVRYAGQTTSAYLTSRRSIEDRLLYHKLNLDHEISIHYQKPERHSNDKRKAASSALLCISETYATTSPWLKNEVLQAMDGNIEQVPMHRPCDIRPRPQSRSGPAPSDTSPAERHTQRGPEATKAVLQALLAGQGLTRGDGVLVVDQRRLCDWAEGVFNLQMMHNNGDNVPFVGYTTVFTGDLALEDLEHEDMVSRLQGKFMTEWWEPRAGPSEPTTRPDDEVDKPELGICTWAPEGTVIIPSLVLDRFPQESPMHKAWTDFCQVKIQELARAQAGRSRASAREADTRRAPPALTEPDWSIDPPPAVLGDHATIEEIAIGDFPIKDTKLGTASSFF